MAKCWNCTNYTCRCDSCPACVEKEHKWFCDEMQNFCENIMECFEFDIDTGCEEDIS